MWGRIKGMTSMPQAGAAEHVTRRPWKAPMPGLDDVLRSAWMSLGGSDVRRFWSETWVNHAHLLEEMVGVVRAARPAPLVEVDDGWRPDRDFSVAVGRWGWLHVQALVEEHAQGRCLMRVRSRLSVSAVGTMQAMAITATMTLASLVLMSIHWRSGSALAVLAMAVVATRTAWQTTRAAAVLDRALDRVVHDAGMITLHRHRSGERPAPAAPITGAAEGIQAAPGA
jgi:hypothetical protein